MKSRNRIVVLFAIALGFATGFVSRPYLSDLAVDAGAETQTLTFDSNVTAYTYSEKGVVRIKKVDDRNYVIKSVSPGMCVVSFSTANQEDLPQHLRRGRFIVLVSPNKKLTIQETKFVAGGML